MQSYSLTPASKNVILLLLFKMVLLDVVSSSKTNASKAKGEQQKGSRHA